MNFRADGAKVGGFAQQLGSARSGRLRRTPGAGGGFAFHGSRDALCSEDRTGVFDPIHHLARHHSSSADIRIEGRENIPERGGALLLLNHVSVVDAFLVCGCIQRFIRQVVYKPYYESKLSKLSSRA
ncbi:MAG: hypothetical protein R2724_16965 [Bryobacterales bacterium]